MCRRNLLTVSLVILVSACNASQAQHPSSFAVTDTTQQVEEKVGYVFFQTDVDSFYVAVDEDFDHAPYISSQDSLTLSPGRHTIRIIKKYYMDNFFNVNVKPNLRGAIVFEMRPFDKPEDQKKRSSYPRLHWGALAVVKTDPEADLYMDGTFVGKGVGMIDSTGTFDIQSRFPSGKVLSKTIDTQKQLTPFHVYELFHRPDRKTSLLLSLLPGATQIYQREKIKGYGLLASTLIGSGLAVKFHIDFANTYRTFKRTRTRYTSSSEPSQALELGDLAERQLRQANKVADKRNILLYATTAVYLYNIIDAWIKPNVGYRKTVRIDPYIDFKNKNTLGGGLSVTYTF